MKLWILLAPLLLAAAPAGQYTVATDTVKDNRTGLTWQRATGGPLIFTTALAYSTGLSLGGLTSGWRLPNIKELATLLDETAPNSGELLDVAFPNAGVGQQLWSSTPVSNSSFGRAYILDTGNGTVNAPGVMTTHPVRCAHP